MKRDIKQTHIHTDRRTSRLLDQIGPVGRFDENNNFNQTTFSECLKQNKQKKNKMALWGIVNRKPDYIEYKYIYIYHSLSFEESVQRGHTYVNVWCVTDSAVWGQWPTGCLAFHMSGAVAASAGDCCQLASWPYAVQYYADYMHCSVPHMCWPAPGATEVERVREGYYDTILKLISYFLV